MDPSWDIVQVNYYIVPFCGGSHSILEAWYHLQTSHCSIDHWSTLAEAKNVVLSTANGRYPKLVLPQESLDPPKKQVWLRRVLGSPNHQFWDPMILTSRVYLFQVWISGMFLFVGEDGRTNVWWCCWWWTCYPTFTPDLCVSKLLVDWVSQRLTFKLLGCYIFDSKNKRLNFELHGPKWLRKWTFRFRKNYTFGTSKLWFNAWPNKRLITGHFGHSSLQKVQNCRITWCLQYVLDFGNFIVTGCFRDVLGDEIFAQLLQGMIKPWHIFIPEPQKPTRIGMESDVLFEFPWPVLRYKKSMAWGVSGRKKFRSPGPGESPCRPKNVPPASKTSIAHTYRKQCFKKPWKWLFDIRGWHFLPNDMGIIS